LKYLIWLAVTWILLGLESPLLGTFEMQLYLPDVLLITALYVAVNGELLPGVAIVFAAGLLKDGFTLASPVGLFTEIGILSLLAARALLQRVDLRSIVPLMATAAAASIAASGLFLALQSVFDRDFAGHDQVIQTMLPLALATMIMAPLQFGLMDRAAGVFGRRDQKNVLLR
jgi:hypothetical protein